MINEPTVDEMTRKLGTDEDPVSAYVLCVVAAKRARQIAEQEQSGGLYAADDGEKRSSRRARRSPKARSVIPRTELSALFFRQTPRTAPQRRGCPCKTGFPCGRGTYVTKEYRKRGLDFRAW